MTTNETVLLGRQPVLDADRMTFGHELLHVAGDDVAGADAEHAGQIVMQRVLLDWGVESAIGHRFGLIRTTVAEVRSGIHRALPPEGIILQLDVRDPEADALDVLDEARADGYHFALRGVTGLDDLARTALLPLVSLVKVEIEGRSVEELSAIVADLRERAPKVLLVADGVDTLEAFARCSDIGFALFQGYFFAEPEILAKDSRPTGSAAAIKLLAEMQSADVGVDRAEQLVASDPTLAYRLLSVVNSSAFGLDRRVESLRHAIVLLGMTQVRNLAMLLTVSTGSTASEELIALGATRARFSARLQDDRHRADSAFTVVLLSVADAIFGTPMDELVAQLPLAEEIATALVDGAGELGDVLDLALACERSDLDGLERLRPDDHDAVRERYLEAAAWADDVRAELPADRRRSSPIVPIAPAPWFETPPQSADRVADPAPLAAAGSF